MDNQSNVSKENHHNRRKVKVVPRKIKENSSSKEEIQKIYSNNYIEPSKEAPSTKFAQYAISKMKMNLNKGNPLENRNSSQNSNYYEFISKRFTCISQRDFRIPNCRQNNFLVAPNLFRSKLKTPSFL
jgi:hypothetical protein